jgi:hypothetical protein
VDHFFNYTFLTLAQCDQILASVNLKPLTTAEIPEGYSMHLGLVLTSNQPNWKVNILSGFGKITHSSLTTLMMHSKQP